MAISVAATAAAAVNVPAQPVRQQPSAPAAAGQVSRSAGTASPPQQKAALNRLLAKYKYEMAHSATSTSLASLGRQITLAAKAAGQHVTLPRAPAASGGAAASGTAEVSPAPTGLLKITA